MPFLQVLYSKDEPLALEQKQAFAKEVLEILREEIGAQQPSVRLTFEYLDPSDTLAVIEESAEQKS